MICFYSSADYNTMIFKANHGSDAPAICRQLELERNDGYSVVASQDGRIIADGSGWRAAWAMLDSWPGWERGTPAK